MNKRWKIGNVRAPDSISPELSYFVSFYAISIIFNWLVALRSFIFSSQVVVHVMCICRQNWSTLHFFFRYSVAVFFCFLFLCAPPISMALTQHSVLCVMWRSKEIRLFTRFGTDGANLRVQCMPLTFSMHTYSRKRRNTVLTLLFHIRLLCKRKSTSSASLLTIFWLNKQTGSRRRCERTSKLKLFVNRRVCVFVCAVVAVQIAHTHTLTQLPRHTQSPMAEQGGWVKESVADFSRITIW